MAKFRKTEFVMPPKVPISIVLFLKEHEILSTTYNIYNEEKSSYHHSLHLLIKVLQQKYNLDCHWPRCFAYSVN